MEYMEGMEVIDSTLLDEVISAMDAYDYDKYTDKDVENALSHDVLTTEDFAALLSPAALNHLEEMAQRAQIETRKHFGNSISMFTPLYIANYCENYCIYCGFNCYNKIRRAKLSEEEIKKEMQEIAKTGLQEILLLTGESRKMSDVEYIGNACKIANAQLIKEMGKHPDEYWTDDDRLIFSSVYARFTAAFHAQGGQELEVSSAEAFLSFLHLYCYKRVEEMSVEEINELVKKAWEEFVLLQYNDEEKVELKMTPTEDKPSLFEKWLPLGGNKEPSHLKVGFIYAKTPHSSAWTYSHELGRRHLEQTFPNEVTTVSYENITEKNIASALEEAIHAGCNIIFTTTPIFAQESLRAAITHPEVRILNCSLNTTHRYIRTYYTRMHEAKFLMGAIAGEMAENDKIVYIADYPILGTIAQINAFALGAQMTNPRAKVYLEWSTLKEQDIEKRIDEIDPNCISGKDIIVPDDNNHFYGVYHRESGGGEQKNLAMPLCHWGKFYEELIRTIMAGNWEQDNDVGKAINYWWGMPTGVVDVICSKKLPAGTVRLVNVLKHNYKTGQFHTFTDQMYAQGHILKEKKGETLSPEEVIEMDWLAENIIGRIPKIEELQEQAKPVLTQQGIETRKG